jgi:PKD repeat protein
MKSNRRLVLVAVFSICAIAIFGIIPSANAKEITTGPVVNPYLASPLYAITHFDSSQSDSTPYGPPRGFFTVDPAMKPISYGGPINIITLASTNKDYMWAVGSNRVSYVDMSGGNWREVAKFEALANATDNVLPAIPDENFRTFGESSAVGMNVTSMDSFLKSLFGDNYQSRGGHGSYSAVDNNNVLYTNYGDTLYAFALKDPGHPSAGITVRYKIEHIVATIEGNDPAPPPGTRLFGLSMTYDGHIIVTFSNGVAVLDRDLDITSKSFYRFPDNEFVSNSIAVDEHNGIYIASNSIMRKLVWTGTTLSANESDGAWSSPYDNSVQKPPIISFSNGTGSTPTLMGFGNDPDKLVVITDGASQMKLVAFWRDSIPEGFIQKPGTKSRRIAGQIPVTCGFTTLPEYIQSEQSVVVEGYGAFVVNNIPATVDPELENLNQILQVSLMGPAYPASFGVERFLWNPSTHEWSSVWGRSDVSSTSMIPVHSQSGTMALINGYREPDGWEVLGLDWNTGDTVHQTILGKENFGNGAYAILQYLDNGDLLFNSIAGPIRIHYGSGPKPQFFADFAVSPTSGLAPLTVKCIDRSVGNPTRYNYDFGDGFNLSGPTPSHTYRFPGSYNITMTIMKFDKTGSMTSNSTTKRNIVTVTKLPFISPVARFTASPQNGTAPLTVRFIDQPGGSPTFYSYNFGDGINMTGPNPVHTYRNPGTYTVTFTVMKNDVANGTMVSNSSVLKDFIVIRSK